MKIRVCPGCGMQNVVRAESCHSCEANLVNVSAVDDSDTDKVAEGAGRNQDHSRPADLQSNEYSPGAGDSPNKGGSGKSTGSLVVGVSMILGSVALQGMAKSSRELSRAFLELGAAALLLIGAFVSIVALFSLVMTGLRSRGGDDDATSSNSSNGGPDISRVFTLFFMIVLLVIIALAMVITFRYEFYSVFLILMLAGVAMIWRALKKHLHERSKAADPVQKHLRSQESRRRRN